MARPMSCVPAALLLASMLLLCLLNQVAVIRAGADVVVVQEYEAIRHRHQLLSIIDCPRACALRCSKSSRKKICVPNCKACCRTCNCVPSGTAGNRQECTCYATLKNSKGTGKCP